MTTTTTISKLKVGETFQRRSRMHTYRLVEIIEDRVGVEVVGRYFIVEDLKSGRRLDWSAGVEVVR